MTHPIEAFHLPANPGLRVLKSGKNLTVQLEWLFSQTTHEPQEFFRPVSKTRCKTQKTNNKAPITIRVHQELSEPSNMMSD
jgi:hypothetical protein